MSEGAGAGSPASQRGRAGCLAADPEDALSDDEPARLNEALTRGFESIKAGRFREAADVIAGLRRG